MEPPIFVLGSHKSGTSLFRSLLDGHPSLCVLPREPHFFLYGGHWVEYSLKTAPPQSQDYSAFVDRACAAIAKDNAVRNPYSDSPEFGGYPPEVVRRSLAAPPEPMTLAARYERYIAALHASIADRLPAVDGHRVVDKSTEYFEYAQVLSHAFPQAHFVHVIRDPYAAMVSIRNYRLRRTGKYPLLDAIVKTMAAAYHQAYVGSLVHPRYRVIRYEDLLDGVESTMRTVVDFLDIPWDPVVTKPTSLGAPWGGNSTRDEAFDAVSDTPRNAWVDEITAGETHLVNKTLGSVQRVFGYDRVEPSSRLARLARGPSESGRVYLANRIPPR